MQDFLAQISPETQKQMADLYFTFSLEDRRLPKVKISLKVSFKIGAKSCQKGQACRKVAAPGWPARRSAD